MIYRIVIIVLGTVALHLLRSRVVKKPLAPVWSALIGIAVMSAGIQYHYHFLPHEDFGGGVAYASLGFIAFLVLNRGYRKP